MRLPALSRRIRQWRRRRTLPKLVLVFMLLATGYLLFAIGPSHAQTNVSTDVGKQTTSNNYSPSFNPDVPRDQHSYVQSVVIELLASMVCQLGGFDPLRQDHRCLGVDPQTGKIGFVENGGGAIGVMGTFIAYTFTPPISSTDYVRYLAGNFGITKKTYAQAGGPSPCVGNSP